MLHAWFCYNKPINGFGWGYQTYFCFSKRIFPSYLWFFAKQPQFVLGSAHGVFGVCSWAWAAVLLPVSFRCVADGAIRTGSAQILTEVLKGVVPWRVEARLKWLYHDGRILGETEDGRWTGVLERRACQRAFGYHLPSAHPLLWRQQSSRLDIWKW